MSLLDALLRLPAGSKKVSAVSSPSSPTPSAAAQPVLLIDPAGEALALLNRLKCYTLPAGRMPAARKIAQRCVARLVRWQDGEPVGEVDDPASILAVLRDIERELIAIGGSPDAKLAEAVEMVERTFPGARLVK